MLFLIAKILVLLLLAAAFGAWLGAWWTRRRFVDVTVEHTSLRSEWSAWRADIDKRLATPPDFGAVMQRLASIETSVRGIHIPAPPPVDLGPVLGAVGAIRMPQPERVDLEPLAARLTSRLAALEERIAGLRFPQPPAPPDLAPMRAAIELRLEALQGHLSSLRMPEPAPAPDLQPLQAGLRAVEQRVAGIVMPAAKEPDLAPLTARLGAVEEALRALKTTEPPPPVDLRPMTAELAALRERVAAWRMPEIPPPPPMPPTPPAPNLAPLFEPLAARLGAMEVALRGLKPAEPPAPVDLRPVTAELAALRERIAAWRMPEAPAAVDLQPLQQRLQALEAAIGGIRLPAAPPAPDLAPVQRQLEALASTVSALPRALPAPAGVDFGPVQERIGRVEQALRGIVVPPAPDLTPLHERLRGLEQRISAIRIPEPSTVPPAPPPVDLGPLLLRLDAMAAQWRERSAAAPPPAQPAAAASATTVAPRPAPPLAVRPGSRNLLVRASHGRPDDLKRIKGVAEVLEKMLHGIGVYYFWQIAEWNAQDIAHVDTQLTAFKGRVQRDEWVAQARRFVREGGVALKPTAG